MLTIATVLIVLKIGRMERSCCALAGAPCSQDTADYDIALDADEFVEVLYMDGWNSHEFGHNFMLPSYPVLNVLYNFRVKGVWSRYHHCTLCQETRHCSDGRITVRFIPLSSVLYIHMSTPYSLLWHFQPDRRHRQAKCQ